MDFIGGGLTVIPRWRYVDEYLQSQGVVQLQNFVLRFEFSFAVSE